MRLYQYPPARPIHLPHSPGPLRRPSPAACRVARGRSVSGVGGSVRGAGLGAGKVDGKGPGVTRGVEKGVKAMSAELRHALQLEVNVAKLFHLGQWCQDFFFGGPNLDSHKPWRAATSIASSSLLRSAFFSLVDPPPPRSNPCSSPPGGWGGVHINNSDIFQCGLRATTCGPRAATQVRPASNAGRESRGPHFAISRATLQC